MAPAGQSASKDPALRALKKAVDAERTQIRHLERAVSQARDHLQAVRANRVVVLSASATSSGSSYSGSTSSSEFHQLVEFERIVVRQPSSQARRQPLLPLPRTTLPIQYEHGRVVMTVHAPEVTWTRHTFAAMGTVVVVSLPAGSDTDPLHGRVETLFGRVERSCTRFDQGSDLMRANADPASSHEVAPECAAIVGAAYEAHRTTGGLFDPRILDRLLAVGYDRTFAEVSTAGAGAPPTSTVTPLRSRWQPTVDLDQAAITLGPTPVDLGGIGKGWTVDAAAVMLAAEVGAFLVNAGGDLAVAGDGPDGDGWTVAVEGPRDPTVTLAVLQLRSGSCATSSTGRRRWIQGDQERHHLIDPRTGGPAAGGLQSVTVVADTTIKAETWSKALLIAGRDRIGELCQEHQLAAYWVTDAGDTGHSAALGSQLIWERSSHA